MTPVERLAREFCRLDGRSPEADWELYLSTAARFIAFEDNPFDLTPGQVAELEKIACSARVNYHGIIPFLRELAARGYRIAKDGDVGE